MTAISVPSMYLLPTFLICALYHHASSLVDLVRIMNVEMNSHLEIKCEVWLLTGTTYSNTTRLQGCKTSNTLLILERTFEPR